jgi:hypothetical protein
MPIQSVACPGCKSTLKAPESMAGKKAKCKKCGTSFRIPGGDEPSSEAEGDSQFLSVMDLSVPAAGGANPFDFGGSGSEPEPKPKPVEKAPAKKSAVVSKPEPKAAAPAPAKAVAKVPPKPPAPKKPVVEDDIPAAVPVEDEIEDSDDAADEAAAAPETAGDPFSFSNDPAPAVAKEKSKAKERPKPRVEAPAEEADDDELPTDDDIRPAGKRHHRTKGDSTGGMGKLIIAAVVFAVITGAIIGGVLIYLNGNKPPEQAKNEKKEEKAPDPGPADPLPPPSGDSPKAVEVPNSKDKTPPKKEPVGKRPVAPGGGPMLGLAPGRTITFLPQSEKPEPVQEPSNRLAIVPTLPGKSEDAFAAARRVFPPPKRDIDIGVLWQTEAGFQGSGEKLLLGIYSPQTGKQANQIAFVGDGSPEPVCDLSGDANLFAFGNTKTSTVTIWDTRTGTKVLDAFNPYAGKKDLKLAAVFITEPPTFFIAVTTTGAVHAFNIASKEPKTGEFAPAKPPSQPLVLGKHIIPGPERRSVVIYAGGSFYQVTVAPTIAGQEIARLDGEVGRSFGIARSASDKLLFAFETETSGKKEKAVMDVRTDGNHVFYRWPEQDAGEPSVVGWVDDNLAMIGTNRGSCVWFEAEGKDFKPVGLARTPNDKGRHVASDGHWTLLPDPTNPKQCVLVEYSKPQSGIVGVLDSAAKPPSVLLTDKGLLK